MHYNLHRRKIPTVTNKESLNNTIHGALAWLEDDPNGELSRGWRCRIYQALGSDRQNFMELYSHHHWETTFFHGIDFSTGHQRRTNLAVLVAKLILPIWNEVLPTELTFSHRYLPDLYLYTAEQLPKKQLSLKTAGAVFGEMAERTQSEADIFKIISYLMGNERDKACLEDGLLVDYPFPLEQPPIDLNITTERKLSASYIFAAARFALGVAINDEYFFGDEKDDYNDVEEQEEPAFLASRLYKPRKFWQWWLTRAVPYAYDSVFNN